MTTQIFQHGKFGVSWELCKAMLLGWRDLTRRYSRENLEPNSVELTKSLIGKTKKMWSGMGWSGETRSRDRTRFQAFAGIFGHVDGMRRQKG